MNVQAEQSQPLRAVDGVRPLSLTHLSAVLLWEPRPMTAGLGNCMGDMRRPSVTHWFALGWAPTKALRLPLLGQDLTKAG